MPDTTRSGLSTATDAGSASAPVWQIGSTVHIRRLDLADLLSPIPPSWLTPSDGILALPFDDGVFDHVAIGRSVLDTVNLPDCFAELRRVLARGGELTVTIGCRGEITEFPPSLATILIEAHKAFRIRSTKVGPDSIVLSASNDLTDNYEDSPNVPVFVGAFATQVSEARRSSIEHSRTVNKLEEKRKIAADDAARLDEALRRRTKELEVSRAALEETKRNLEAARKESTERLRLAQQEADKLRTELQKARDQVQYERWRVSVAENRKATRIARQLRRLREPWRLPEVMYRVARITTAPPVQLPAPVPTVKAPVKSDNRVRHSVEIRPVAFPPAAPRRPGLRIATILDEFSELAFRYEFQTIPVPREGWKELFDRQRPDLLLVESAWNGNGGVWKYAFTGEEVPKRAVLDLLEYFRSQGLPTVFWNKEDPLEYDLFIRTARHFDWVFTVDENCVEKYLADLGHHRLGVLPFGVQPQIHNPIDSFKERRENIAFAGTYYSGKYPERRQQMDNLLKPAANMGLHIFSRWESNPRYGFPDDLKECVVGSLDYAQTLAAYRQYKIFLNVNSVTDSRTMFSRRVLELLACGTPVVSGPSPGMAAMLGQGAVYESTDPETTRLQVRSLLNSPELRDRQAVRGVRSVMDGNTYSDRVDHLLATLGLPIGARAKTVSIIAPTNRQGAFRQILKNASQQNHRDLELILALHGVDEDEGHLRDVAAEMGVANLQILRVASDWSLGRVLNELCARAAGDYIARMDDDDLYGPNYLSDQLRAFTYTEADVVGKWSRFISLEDVPCLGVIFPGHEHRYTELIGGGTILARKEVFEAVKFPDRSTGEDTQFLRESAACGMRIYSTDRFNHVYVRYSDTSRHTYRPHDLQHLSNTRIVSFDSTTAHAFV